MRWRGDITNWLFIRRFFAHLTALKCNTITFIWWLRNIGCKHGPLKHARKPLIRFLFQPNFLFFLSTFNLGKSYILRNAKEDKFSIHLYLHFQFPFHLFFNEEGEEMEQTEESQTHLVSKWNPTFKYHLTSHKFL